MDMVEAPVSKQEVGTAVQHVGNLFKRLLAEHDRSSVLRQAGVRGSSGPSNGNGQAAGAGNPAPTRTDPNKVRRRRQALVVENPEKIELSSTDLADSQSPLPETGDNERTLEL